MSRTVTGNNDSSNIPSIKASTLLSNGQLVTSYGNFIHVWDKSSRYYDVTLRVHTSGIRFGWASSSACWVGIGTVMILRFWRKTCEDYNLFCGHTETCDSADGFRAGTISQRFRRLFKFR